MEQTKYSLGIDYGSESGRAVLLNLSNGEIVAEAVMEYPHGVIVDKLPGLDVKLGKDWALQNPDDYVDVFVATVSDVLKQQPSIGVEDIIGIGIDFTACTMLPVKYDGTPLCKLEEYRSNPHSWVKLWKHHAAQEEANRLNDIAASRGEKFLQRYGGKISSEWLIPKIWQILNEAPEIYEASNRFIEAADWIVWQLTGNETRNACTAGYKAIWHKQDGYPDKAFFASLDPRLENLVEEKLGTVISELGDRAGGLTNEMAKRTGLLPGTAVAIGNVDAHVSVAPAGVTQPGTMLMIMGTSTCDILLDEEEHLVPGICGVVEGGAVPGLFGYESGQNAVGDIFAWFTKNCVPASYHEEALAQRISIHTLLEERAAKLEVGESGLLALDWHNGNRSILVDTDLTGLIVGLTLHSKPEEIYRALIEATAFAKKVIIDAYRNNGVRVDHLVACGGLPHKNQLLMQIYADVTGLDVAITAHLQTPAVGSAMYGAVAAGREAGGFDNIVTAAEKLARLKDKKIVPNVENHQKYEALYKEYVLLHDYFGRGENDVMKRLKAIKNSYN